MSSPIIVTLSHIGAISGCFLCLHLNIGDFVVVVFVSNTNHFKTSKLPNYQKLTIALGINEKLHIKSL